MSEASVILITLYITIGIVIGVIYFLSEMKGKDWYLSGFIALGLCLIGWPVAIALVLMEILAHSDQILIRRKK